MKIKIYDDLIDLANKVETKALFLESEAEKMYETAKFLRGLVDGNVRFLVDNNGAVVDTESVIPDAIIRRRKRGDGYIVEFGKFGGAFHGFLDGFEGDGVVREAIKVIARVVYRNAEAYAKTLESTDAADALPEPDMWA